MCYSDVLSIALAILTSIITGGFVLVFVEIGNRKNRENDKHDQIMAPFMHKLSAYFRYISWSACQGTGPEVNLKVVSNFLGSLQSQTSKVEV